MLAHLNIQILEIVRKLEHDQYLSLKKRQQLEKELEILLEKRDKYYETTGLHKRTATKSGS